MALSVSLANTLLAKLAKPVAVSLLSGGSALVFGSSSALPFVFAYPWVDGVGFGTKYADPVSALPGGVTGAAFEPFSGSVILAHGGAPNASAYAWTTASGFGTKYANPASLPATGTAGVAIAQYTDKSYSYVAICNVSTPPFIETWKFSKTGAGWSTRYADAAPTLAGGCNGLAYNPAGTAILGAHSGSPLIGGWPWSDSGYGTKYANPATLSTAVNAYACPFDPGGAVVGLGTTLDGDSQICDAWAFDAVTGFGTKYAGPALGASWAGNAARSATITSDVFAIGNSPGAGISCVTVWAWSASGGFGTRYGQPVSSPAGLGSGVGFNQSKTTLFASTFATPYVNAWAWSGGFGTKYANPVTIPSNSANCVAVAV